MSSNGNEKRSAESNKKSRRNSVGREVTENAASTTASSPSPSTEQHGLSEPRRGSQQERGVARRCYPIPTEIQPGAEAVRGPEYSEEDEEGTVIIGERSEVVESDEIVTARVVNVDTEEDLRSQVGSLQEQLRRNETVGGIRFITRDQPPNSLLPESPPLYGREEELKKLGEVLNNTGGRMAALVGGAGMGKSHCASHFARTWLREDPDHRFVLWLESDTENIMRVSYLKALETILKREVPETKNEMNICDIACLVWQALGEQSTQFEWMVVYNNVPEVLGDSEGPEAFSPLFFPTPMENWAQGRILLTTRCTSYGGRIRSLGNHHVTKVQVEPLKESAAVVVLMDNLEDGSGSLSEMDTAQAIVELLDYTPLAIVTANSQMVDASLTVSEYLEDLKSGLTKHEVHSAVSLALANALAYARGHGLGDVLEVAAFLSPDQLSLELLGCDRRTARRLCRLSLLRHSGDDIYTMHRLHQEVARDGLSPGKSITLALQALLSEFNANNSDTWKFGISMIPHIDSLEKNVETARKCTSRENEQYAMLLSSKAEVLHFALHNYREARSYYKQSLEMKRHVYGRKAKNTNLAATLENLGILERNLGNFDKARMYYEEALEMERHVYGRKAMNADLARTLGNLGILEQELGNYDNAHTHYELSLKMKRHVYGPDAKNTSLALTLNNIGILEVKLGKYDKARMHYKEALEMQRNVYGREAKNVDLARTFDNLGSLELELKHYDKARIHYERSLEMQRHVYGPEAKNTILFSTIDSLGTLEKALGNYEAARAKYAEALGIAMDCLGEDAANHPSVEEIRGNLAGVE